MRQVFTSARLENVEAVAAMLREADIEVRITNGRSYKGNRRSSFSYRESASSGQQPAVWVVKSDDQVRARQILRDAGLIESTRPGESSYLAPTFRSEVELRGNASAKRALRIKLALLGAIAVALALSMARMV
ncbi:DUF2007 domain-containing protein [Tolypothrix campylonemoides VB511288]|nr:DUF2007 domain-containing protein [Tolypothrix campylonemoides VB511288]